MVKKKKKDSENSGVAMVADATMNLTDIWSSIIAKKATEGEYAKKYECVPSDSLWATEQSPTMLFALEEMKVLVEIFTLQISKY